jgi:hypothetical protein
VGLREKKQSQALTHIVSIHIASPATPTKEGQYTPRHRGTFSVAVRLSSSTQVLFLVLILPLSECFFRVPHAAVCLLLRGFTLIQDKSLRGPLRNLGGPPLGERPAWTHTPELVHKLEWVLARWHPWRLDHKPQVLVVYPLSPWMREILFTSVRANLTKYVYTHGFCSPVHVSRLDLPRC